MMRTMLYALMAALIGLSAIGLQACFDEAPVGWGPARQAHEEREFRYGPKHEVCDAFGNNCVICDYDNDYCRRIPNYGRYSYSDAW